VFEVFLQTPDDGCPETQKFHLECGFWVITLYSLVSGYQKLMMKAAGYPKMLVTTFWTTQSHNPEEHNRNTRRQLAS
jgi:hypothetical protein